MTSIKRHLILGSLLVGALAVPALASADDAAAPAATPTPEAWYQKIQVGGYLDAYYQLDLNELSSTAPLGYRAYNAQVNQFTYGGGQLTLKQNDSASGTGYFVDLLMGQMNSVYDANSNDPLAVELGEAYVTQTFGNATFTLGKFATPIGYEGTYLPSDANFSRSLLYQAEPTFQTGLELSYNLPASLTAALWVDDGPSEDSSVAPNWASIPPYFQYLYFDNNSATSGKGYGAQVGYTGVKNLSLTGTYYLEDDLDSVNTTTGETGISRIQLINGIASYTATDSLSFAGEYLIETATGNWASDEYAINDAGTGNYLQSSGYALYATYSPIANLSISPRFTQWFNPNTGEGAGASGYVYGGSVAAAPYQLDDYTLTLKYQMGPLAHILEYEALASNLAQFPGGAGNDNTTYAKPTTVQQTLTYAAVYSF